MAILRCISIPGIRLWFYSNDHTPPHFHAKRKGEWIYKVKFQESDDTMFELVWSAKKSKISKSDKELIVELVDNNRFEILKEWEVKVKRS
jgi:hypothetical protein